jgi:hypothetical protein
MLAKEFMKYTILALSILALFASTISLADDAAAPTTNPSDSPATQPDQSAKKSGPSKFYGVVSAIDATAKTFTIDGITYQLTDDSAMTKGDGSAATLADAVVGQPARGSYHKAHDGTLNITKVRFGKKVGGKGGGKKKKSATSQPDAA